MGARANYILIERGKTTIYYHHWGAYQLLSDLIWGYAVARRFIENLPPDPELLPDAWCEGAVILDIPNRTLLLWSDTGFKQASLRRIYLDWLEIAWPGWQAFWAHNRMFDIARYLGLPLPTRNSHEEEKICFAPLVADDTPRLPGNTLVTLRLEEGSQVDYLVKTSAPQALCTGARIFDFLARQPQFNISSSSTEDLLDDYLLLDASKHRIDFSTHHYYLHPNSWEHVRTHWTGWTIQRHHDGLYDHCLRSGYDWKLCLPPAEDLITRLTQSLLDCPSVNTHAFIQALGKAARTLGGKVEISPYFTQDNRPDIHEPEKQAWLSHIADLWWQREDTFEASLARREDFDWETKSPWVVVAPEPNDFPQVSKGNP